MTQPKKSNLPGGLGIQANSELTATETVLRELSGSGEGILVTRDRVIIVKAGLNLGSSNARKSWSYPLLHINNIEVKPAAFGTAIIQLTIVDPNIPFHAASDIDQRATVTDPKAAAEFADLVKRGVTWWQQQNPPQPPMVAPVIPVVAPTLPPPVPKSLPPATRSAKTPALKPKKGLSTGWLIGLGLIGACSIFALQPQSPPAQPQTSPVQPQSPSTPVIAAATASLPEKPIVSAPPQVKPLSASEKLGRNLKLIASNPKSIKPTVVDRSKNSTFYYYDKITGATDIQLIVPIGKPNAWEISFTPSGVTPEKLSGLGNVQEIKEMRFGMVYKFTNGTLKGAFLYPQTFNDGSKKTVIQSRDYVISQKVGAIAVAMVEKGMMPNVEFISNGSLISTCEDLVKQNLKSPTSAKFAGFLEKLEANISTEGNGNRLYKSYVDSENSFGALLRTNFECKYTSSDGYVRVQLYQQ